MLAVLAMTTAFFSVGVTVAGYREGGTIRRLRSTPLRPSMFFLSIVVVRYLIILAQAAVLIALSMIVFGASNHGNWFSFLLVLTVGSLSFLSLGFAIASITKTTQSAVAVSNAIFVPLMMVSGAFYPITSYPQIIKDVVTIFPLYHLIEGVRGIWTSGLTVGGSALTLGLLVVWMVFGYLISAWRFRWE